MVAVCGWHLHRHHRGPQFLIDTTNTGWGLLSGHQWGPPLDHQWILFHGHGHQVPLPRPAEHRAGAVQTAAQRGLCHAQTTRVHPAGVNNPSPVRPMTAPQKRCSAHSSRTGEPCKTTPDQRFDRVRVARWTRSAVKRKARQRLEEASDRLARQLLGIAEGAESEAVRLAAVKDALDRAGIQAKTAATVESSVKPLGDGAGGYLESRCGVVDLPERLGATQPVPGSGGPCTTTLQRSRPPILAATNQLTNLTVPP